MSLYFLKKSLPLCGIVLSLTGCGMAPVDIALSTLGTASTFASSRQQSDFSDPRFVERWNYATMLLENDRERYVKGQPSAFDWNNYANLNFRRIEDINTEPELIPLFIVTAYQYDRHGLDLDDQGQSHYSAFKKSAEVSLAELFSHIASAMKKTDTRAFVWSEYEHNRKKVGLEKIKKDFFEQELVKLSQQDTAFLNRKMELVGNESAANAEEERRNTRQVKATIPVEVNTAAEKRIQTVLNAIPFTESVLSSPRNHADTHFNLRIGKMNVVLNRYGLAREIESTMQQCKRLGMLKNDPGVTTQCLNKYAESIRQWGNAARMKGMDERAWEGSYYDAKDSGFFFFSHWTAEAKRSSGL